MSGPNPDKKRVLAIGLDSADFRIVEWLLSNDRLSNIRSIFGVNLKELASTIPPNTAPSWTSMFTGVNPGKHGVYYFRNLDTGRLLSSKDVKMPYIWDRLTAVGVKSIIVNVPLTYPVKPMNGIMIAGLHASSANPQSVYPARLVEKVRQNYAFDIFDIEWSNSFLRDEANAHKTFLDGDLRRTDFFIDLISEEDWQLAVIVLTSLDRIQHLYWDSSASKGLGSTSPVVQNAYEFMDLLVGKIVKRSRELGDVMTFVVSDHGFERKDITVSVNDILEDASLLRSRRLSKNIDSLITTSYYKISQVMPTRIGVPIGRVGRAITSRLLGHSRELSPVDFQQSVAYSYPYGLVKTTGTTSRGLPPARGASTERVAMILQQKFERLGLPIKVVSAGEVFWGNEVSRGPHLVLLPIDGVWYSNEVPIGGVKVSGNHSMHGILMSNVNLSSRTGTARTWDIGATILDALEYFPPEEFDGKSLICSNSPKSNLPRVVSEKYGLGSALSAEEESEISKRLKRLGYT